MVTYVQMQGHFSLSFGQAFIHTAVPSGRQEQVFKGNLPRLELDRPISVRSLGVRHSIHFGVLLLDDARGTRGSRSGSLITSGLGRCRRSPAG